MEGLTSHATGVGDPSYQQVRANSKLRRVMKAFQDAQQDKMTKKERKLWMAASDLVSRLQEQELSRVPGAESNVQDNQHLTTRVAKMNAARAAALPNIQNLAAEAPLEAVKSRPDSVCSSPGAVIPELGNRDKRKVRCEKTISTLHVSMPKDDTDPHSLAWQVLASHESAAVAEKARKAFKELENGSVTRKILADAFGFSCKGLNPKCKKDMDRVGITNAMAEYVFGDRAHNFLYVLNHLQDKAAFNFATTLRTAVYLGTKADDVKTITIPVHLAKGILAFFCGEEVDWATVVFKLYKFHKEEKFVFKPMWIPRLLNAWKSEDEWAFQTSASALNLLHLCPASVCSRNVQVKKRRVSEGGLVPKGWEDAGQDAKVRLVIDAFKRTRQVTNFFLCPAEAGEQ